MRALGLIALVLSTACSTESAEVPAEDVFGFGDPAELDLARELAAPHLLDLADRHALQPDGFLEMQSQVDELAMAHVKVQQTVDGVPVFAAQAIVHLHADGSLRKVTDALLPAIEVDTVPAYTAEEAIDVAQVGLDFQSGAPQSELVILRHEGADHLVWKVQLEAIEGPEPTAPLVFIDAHTNEEVWRFDNLKHAGTSGTGDTNYYGSVSLDIYEDSGTYYTEDDTRGDGIGTYTYNGTTSSLYYVSDSDTDFAETWQEEAVEAHWGAQQVYDFYDTTFSRNGIDGSGGPGDSTGLNGNSVVSLYVNYDSNYNNAFWYGAMYFGDGDGSYFSPLTSIDITGHEMTHGVTEDEVYLTYYGEPGAIDESYADVMGSMVERFVFGDSTEVYEIAEECYTPSVSGDAMRYMYDPTADAYSVDHYDDVYTGTSDSGGVHLNSGIGNIAFYLMAEGGTHPTYGDSVTGIGADDATAIWYRALTTYLTSSSDFADLRDAQLDAATDLYGSGSTEYCGVEDAWAATGVGSVSASCSNSAPTAVASIGSGTVGSAMTLDGTGSTDPDGDTLTYRWKLTAAPSGSANTSGDIADRNASSTSFTPDTAGSYSFQLKVTDPSGALDKVVESVTVISGGNSAPVADAGSDSTGSTGSSVSLDGTGSSDPDGDALTYRWKMLSVPSGSTIGSGAIANRDAASTSFTPDVAGTYALNLKVTDPSGEVSQDQVSFTISAGSGGNSAPVADAGSDASGTAGSSVSLDGTGSSDPDGDALTYRWKMLSVPAGSGVWSGAIADRDAASTSFTPDVAGTYTLNLKVTDPSGETSEDQVSFTISSSGGNNAPNADAGPNQTVTAGANVQLDASASADADGDTLTFRWKLLSAPSGSGITSNSISNRDIADPTVTLNVSGAYRFQVKVDDGTVTDTDIVRITVN